MIEIYVSNAPRQIPTDRESHLDGRTLMVVPPVEWSGTVHTWAALAVTRSTMSIYSKAQMRALILGSTMSPNKLPSRDDPDSS
jgi:hypothetical protein